MKRLFRAGCADAPAQLCLPCDPAVELKNLPTFALTGKYSLFELFEEYVYGETSSAV